MTDPRRFTAEDIDAIREKFDALDGSDVDTALRQGAASERTLAALRAFVVDNMAGTVVRSKSKAEANEVAIIQATLTVVLAEIDRRMADRLSAAAPEPGA